MAGPADNRSPVGCVAVAFLPFLAAGLVGVAVAGVPETALVVLRPGHEVEVPGTVLETATTYYPKSRTTGYSATVSYRLDGHDHRTPHPLTAESFAAVKVGDPVPVRVVPAFPERSARTDPPDRTAELRGLAELWGFLAVYLGLVIAGFLLTVARLRTATPPVVSPSHPGGSPAL